MELGWRWTPLDAVGIYVPGGRAAYPSSLLMNAVPAKIAGVSRIAMTTPPGHLSTAVLAAAQIVGVSEIWRVGGAQAVAACTSLGASLLTAPPPPPRPKACRRPTCPPCRSPAPNARPPAARSASGVVAVTDVTASFGVRRLNGDDATTVMAGVSAPFPLFDQNRDNVAAASARANAASARFEDTRLRAEADWRSARAQADAAVDRVVA